MKDSTELLNNIETEETKEAQDSLPRFYELSEETTNYFLDIYNSKAFIYPVKFEFIGDAKLKHVIQIKKIAPEYNHILKADVLVKINEELMSLRDIDNVLEILFTEQIDMIIASEKGVKINKSKLTLNPHLIDKYGIDAVLRANSIEVLHNEQIADNKESDSDDNSSDFKF